MRQILQRNAFRAVHPLLPARAERFPAQASHAQMGCGDFCFGGRFCFVVQPLRRLTTTGARPTYHLARETLTAVEAAAVEDGDGGQF